MDTVQQAAASIIAKVLSGRNLNQLINETNAALPQLNPQQRGALQDLSYGTLRYYGQLNNVLDQLLLKPVQDMQIRFLLLVALYQLQYTKAAQHAVVDFAVTSMRKINPSAGGLVNAVLRNFLRRKNELLDIATHSETGRYSYPQWWITEIKKQYKDSAENVLLSGNQHPPMTLRINRKQTTTQAYLALLAQNAINAKIIAPDAIILEQPQNVNKLPGFNEGMVSVQDAGAQYAAQFLDVQNGMLVLDACAAPGGKSAHLLESAEIELVALDKDELRLQRVRDNMQRLHLDANICAGDAAKPADWWDGRKFQRILADVPCSATGVVRRHPDIKWLRRPSDIEHFAGQQQEILAALWPLLQAGGKLLYATCSIFDRENQQVINQFLGLHSDATQLALSAPDMISGQLLPTDQHDGFFYALLQKQK